MSLYFPEPYEDEILYSIIARYHWYVGNTDPKDTLKELYGTINLVPSIDLSCNIKKICKAINSNIYNERFFITKHTNLPFYYPFLDRSSQIYVKGSMVNSNGQGIYARLGILAGGTCVKKDLHYCPKCAKEDINNFGEAYFHRIHQVSGVIVCPIHLCLINQYPVKRNEVGRIKFIKMNLKYINFTTRYIKDRKICSELVKIARSIYYILNNDLSSFNLDLITKKYKSMLSNYDLVTPKMRIKQNKLVKMFKNRYCDDLLEMLDSRVNDKQSNWLRTIVRKPRRIIHPIRHILLILFLTNDIESFFEINVKKDNNFSQENWPCLNPASDHYKKFVVNDCKITSDYKTRKLVGTFTCKKCGFIYSRKVNYNDKNNIYKIGRIKNFGEVWENKLLKLINNGQYSLRKMSIIMNCDPKTIVKYARKLGKGSVINSKIKIVENKNLKQFKNYKLEYSKDMLQLIKRHPEYTRSKIRKELKKQYSWFYINDRQWINDNLPEIRLKLDGNYRRNLRVDWNKRDYETYLKVKEMYIRIIRKSKTVRITKSIIGSKLGISALLDYHLDKLPLTRRYLNRVTETVEEFQIRRVNKICRQMIHEDIMIKRWRVMRLAGVKSTCSSKVIERINFYEKFKVD